MFHEADFTDLRHYPRLIPPHFCPSQLPIIKLEQVAFWDERHQKYTIGFLSTNSNTVIMYPKDGEGNPDPNGTFTDEVPTKMHVKYANKIRMSLGDCHQE